MLSIERYVYDSDNQKIGMVVAIPEETGCSDVDQELVFIGWSRCSKKDKFDKKKARLIAYGRARKWAEKGRDAHIRIPSDLHVSILAISEYVESCGNTVPVWIEVFRDLVGYGTN
jgi:hypothetical protein